MLLKNWNDLPELMKCEEVKPYYDLIKQKKVSLICKRLFDIFVSFILITVLLPIILILSVIIKLDSKGPVFYRQKRITQFGREFRIFKFRTMVNNADKKGSLVTLENDSRITKVGEKIRGLRLDEIPQLFNVLLGDMSFVGTRPEVQKYVDCYSKEMRATLLMPAGVTSLASIKFKDEDTIISSYIDEYSSIDDIYVKKVLPLKMRYNIEYISNVSLYNDIKLCFMTMRSVFMKRRN